MSFAASQYRSTSVATSSPVQIVVQLYDAAIRDMMQAQQALESKNTAEAQAKLRHSHAIVSELQASLVHAWAPELCTDLARLYDFVIYVITSSVTGEGQDKLAGAIRVMRELRGAWSEIAKQAP